MIADSRPTRPTATDRLASLKAVVLLAGAVRENALVRAAQRPLIDLPLTAEASVLSAWQQSVNELRAGLGREDLQLVVSTTPSAEVHAAQRGNDAGIQVVVDTGELRGTGGALRDLAERFEPDDLLIVANAHAALLAPLEGMVTALMEAQGDVVLHADGRKMPSGFMLVRVGALLGISRRGFVDFKEQALPLIAAQHLVRVIVGEETTVIPIRTLAGYIKALRLRNQRQSGTPADDSFTEEWPVSFSLVESGAHVSPDARIHDSVVLSGARIESGAILVRSVAGPGARVGDGAFACDRILPDQGDKL